MAHAPAHVSPFSVFRNRNFTLLWLAQLVSEMGTSLVSLAASIYVYRLTGSTLNVGLMLMATAAPSLLIGLLAGVFVDRSDRRHVMIASDVVRMVLTLLIPFMLPYGVVWLYLLTFLTAAAAQFFNPAHASLLPELASEEELTAANSMMAISQYGALVIGFALAGLITGNYAIEWAFYLDALTYVISAACIIAIKAPKVEMNGETSAGAVWDNLKVGVRTITHTEILRSMFLVFLPTFFLFGLLNTLRLPFSIEILGAGEFEYGILESVAVVGFVIGSLLMAARGDRLRPGQWISISFTGMGITGVIFSLLNSVRPAAVVGTVEGFVNAPSVVARSLIIQRNTSREVRGRVFSAFFVARDSCFLLGMAAAGLGDVLGIRALYLAAALGALIVGIGTLFMPGLGQPAAQWLRSISLLRAAPEAPGIGEGRPAILPDFDRLIAHFPALRRIEDAKRQQLVEQMSVVEAPHGAVIVRQGEESDSAYFILEGRAVAGVENDGDYRVLEVMNPGDFFGEIAAVTGMPRTANVVVDKDVTLLEAPAAVLRQIMGDPELARIFMSQITARMERSHLFDMPRFCLIDQGTLTDLRTPQQEPSA